MKGIVFNLLEEVVVRQHGIDAWEGLISTAGVGGSYTSLGSYPDADMGKLVMAAATALSLTPAEVLRWFGRAAIPVLAERYPGFFEGHLSTRPFLLSLNSIIHPEVRKIYPGAEVPEFDYSDDPDGALRMGYHSRRKLCSLAEGFVLGAADHYAEECRFEHSQCVDHGDPNCVFRIELGAKAG